MEKSDYVLYGEIQDYIAQKYDRDSEPIDFVAAHQYLLQSNQSHYGIPALPDFMQWDFFDDSTFVNLCRQIPVLPSLLALPAIKPEIDSRYPYLPTRRTVFVSMEMYGAVNPGHVDDCYTLFYVLSGTCRLTLEGRSFDMKDGEMCVISPRVARGHEISKNSIVISIMIHRDVFENAFMHLLKNDAPLSLFFRRTLFYSEKDFLFFMVTPATDIRQIIQHLFQEFVRYDGFSEDISLHYLNILFAQMIRSAKATWNYYTDKYTYPASISVPYILKYIEEHFTDLTLEDLARHLNYERSYLSKLIHKYTGKTYTELVTGYRMEKAMYYLEYTDLKISEIPELTGYNSTDHFSRTFRNYTGCSPREYRSRHR